MTSIGVPSRDKFCNKVVATLTPMKVLPVPGGPCITANSRVKASLKASIWDWSSPNWSSGGHCSGSRAGKEISPLFLGRV